VQELTQQLPSKVLFLTFLSNLINRYEDVFTPSCFSMYTTPQSERHKSVTHLGMKMLMSVLSGVQIWSLMYWIVETKKGHRNSARWLSSNTYHARGDQILYRPRSRSFCLLEPFPHKHKTLMDEESQQQSNLPFSKTFKVHRAFR
jgi:hypothetical protein